MSTVLQEMKLAAQEAPRVFFAPVVGAAKEMRRQIQLMAAARSTKQQLPKHLPKKSAQG